MRGQATLIVGWASSTGNDIGFSAYILAHATHYIAAGEFNNGKCRLPGKGFFSPPSPPTLGGTRTSIFQSPPGLGDLGGF